MGESTSTIPVAEGRIPQPPGGSSKQVLESFQAEDPQYGFGQLVLPAATGEQLETLLTKVEFHSVLYEDFGLQEIDPMGGRTSIGFYGPPGTGKSMAAEAIADRLGKKIIKGMSINCFFIRWLDQRTAKRLRVRPERSGNAEGM